MRLVLDFLLGTHTRSAGAINASNRLLRLKIDDVARGFPESAKAVWSSDQDVKMFSQIAS